MKKTMIIALLLIAGTTLLKAQHFTMITEGLLANDVLSTLAGHKNDLSKLALKGKVKTLTVKGKFGSPDLVNTLNYIYHFRPDGKFALITTLDGKETHTFTYNQEGNLLSCITLRKQVEHADGFKDNEFITTFQYKNGRLASHTGPFDSTTPYIYNNQGQLTQIGEGENLIRLNAQGQVISCSMASPIEYAYNDTGKLIKRISLNYGMDDTNKVTATYTYNTQGDVIKASIVSQTYEDLYSEDGPKLGKAIGTPHRGQENYTYVYDNKGNWTKLTGSNHANVTRIIEYYPD